MTSDNVVDSDKVNCWSDETLYTEACNFVQMHPSPEQRQLMGLLRFSRTWSELLDFVKHQSERDWSGAREGYKSFYRELQRYLNDPKTGLRQRVKTENLISEGLNRQQEREALDAWAQALAQEFIQHLVAEASLQARVKEE